MRFLPKALVSLLLLAACAAAGTCPELKGLDIRTRPVVTCDFENTSLRDALNFLRTTYKLNMVYAAPSEKLDEILVTLHLRNVTAEQAVRAILRQAELKCTIDTNIVYATTPSREADFQRPVLKQYYVADLMLPLASSSKSKNRSKKDDDDDENGSGRRGRSSREIMSIIVIFTGPKNWDHVGRSGRSSRKKSDKTKREARDSGR